MEPPRILAGRYRLGELLGKGGRGEVHRAVQLDLGREVALKLLANERDVDERARFVREGRVAAELRHPGIAEVFDAGVTEDGIPYLAMELLEGETLASRLARDGALPAADAVHIAVAVCRALDEVHAKGFLHRDVKPSNIFLARGADGRTQPKLIDFGIATRMTSSTEPRRRLITARGLGVPRTSPDIIVGTPGYLSPEQILGDPLDARSDVYAVGANLYEMLTGEPPFASTEVNVLLEGIVRGTVRLIRKRVPPQRVPRALERETLRALSKAPSDRQPSAAALADALERAMETPDEVPLVVPVNAGKLPVALAALALLGLLALVAVGTLTRRHRSLSADATGSPTSVASATTNPAAAPPPPPTGEPQPEAPSTTAAGTASPPPRPRVRASQPSTSHAAATPPPSPPSAAPHPPPRQSFRVDDLKSPY
jgi:serine/threonine-protein kinase